MLGDELQTSFKVGSEQPIRACEIHYALHALHGFVYWYKLTDSRTWSSWPDKVVVAFVSQTPETIFGSEKLAILKIPYQTH